MKRVCASCLFWRTPAAGETGVCKRYPPPQPRTDFQDSCGEWKTSGNVYYPDKKDRDDTTDAG